MATGRPRLAVWDAGDKILRLFELADGSFVQIASTSLNHEDTTVYLPGIHFIKNSAYVFVITSSASHNNDRILYNSTLTKLVNNLSTSAPGAAYFRSSHTDDVVIFSSAQYGVYSSKVNVSVPSIAFVSFTIPSELAENPRAVTVSPTGKFIISGYSGVGVATMVSTINAQGTDYSYKNLSKGSPTDAVVWSQDERYVLLGNRTGSVEVWKNINGDFAKSADITDGLGAFVAMAYSRDLRTAAVSWQTTGSPQTAVYRRTGDVFQKTQVLDGEFGFLLDFTADGRYLIDAKAKRAFEKTSDGFVEAVGMMTNIPAGGIVQAVSAHISNPTGAARLYNGALSALTLDGVDTDGLKILLLDSSASFDPAAHHVDMVGGEVTGLTWPAGGKPLTGVNRVDTEDDRQLRIVCDDVSQIIMGQTMNFRYAVIYDSTVGRPLIFVDFQQVVSADPSTELRFAFSGGLVVYSD